MMTDRESINIPTMKDWSVPAYINISIMLDALAHTLKDLTVGVLEHQEIPDWDDDAVESLVDKLTEASGAEGNEMRAYAEGVQLFRDLSNWYVTKVLGEFVNAGLLPFDAATVQIPNTVPEDFS